MLIQIIPIKLEIYPIEAKGLNQSESRLAKESIQSIVGCILVHDGDDGVSKHKSNECICPFDTMLDADGRSELESFVDHVSESFREVFTVSHEKREEYGCAKVNDDCYPDKNEPVRHLHVN